MTKTTKTAATPAAKTVTVADLARAMKIDPKIARRRMRANVARETPLKTPSAVATPSRKNARYEFTNSDANVAMINAIIADPAVKI
jgi:hypothetical protein